MLLLWGTLQPHGSSSLASVRFSGPVRIRSIRIYPKGASIFAQNPEAISQTEPDAFSLSIFLNAQAAPSAQEPKPKGTNVLVPTRLLYPGGFREFPLDMGPDFVTRLMVIQGDFANVTLAVYGDAVLEPPLDPISYKFMPLPAVFSHRLSPALDPANANEPSILSRELLALIPRAPSLPLAIRLIFCLKPTDEEWNSDRFANLEECVETDVSGLDWLERAAEALMMPVHEGVQADLLKRFAEKTRQALVEKTNDHLYVLAGLLRYASAQPDIVICTILESLDLSDVLEIHLLDKHILERLHDAAANPNMARALSSSPVLTTLQSFRNAYATSQPAKQAAVTLQQRVLGWERFEKALSNPVPDFATVAQWMKDLASEDMTCGVFLLSMLEDESLLLKISRLPVQDPPVSPVALWDSTALASFTDFVAFLRAFMGLSYTMVALCWADNTADTSNTERVFAMLRLWQEADGYREIVNHLLLLPQLMYRLEGTLRHATSPPSLSAMYAEQLLACLYAHPESMIRPELANLIDALPISSSLISADERSEMTEVAMIAEGGLSQAVQTMLTWSNRPVDTTGGRALQAALLILEMALEDRETGEWNVMQASWQGESHGLVYRVVELFGQLVISIHNQFLNAPPPSLQPAILAQLLSSSIAAMRILSRLLPANPLPSRLNRSLSHHITTLFIATEAVDSRYPQSSVTRQAARVARPTCADTLSVLSAISDDSQPGGMTGELVLRTLLHTALYPEGDDPVARLEQVFWLLDLVLPLSISDATGDRTEERLWTRKIIPNLLPELQRFLKALTIDHQIQLMERLTALDRDEVGLGQWFVDEELRHLLQTIESLKVSQSGSDRRAIFQAQVTNSVQFLARVMDTHSTKTPLEFFHEYRTLQDISRVFAALLDYPPIILSVIDFACVLAPHAGLLEPQGQLDLAITLLRSAARQPSAFLHAGTVLPLVGPVLGDEPTRVAIELGPAMQHLADGESQSFWQYDEASLSQAIISCMGWLTDQLTPESHILLPGVSEDSFTTLMSRIATASPQNAKMISEIRPRFAFSDDIAMPDVSDAHGPFIISYDRLSELLTAQSETPSTPRLSGESIFKMATMSPIAALVGSSRTSTLTKTYQNNDFRQLSVRQNTSRRPSMHVDVGI